MNQAVQTTMAHLRNVRINFSQEKAVDYLGVANDVFLQSSNGVNFLKYIEELTNIKFKLVSATEELKIKYDSVIAALGSDKSKDITVWDTSRGSLHIITKINDISQVSEIKPNYEVFYQLLKKKFKRNIILNPIHHEDLDIILNMATKALSRSKTTIPLNNIGIIGTGTAHNYIAQHYVNFQKINNLTRNMSDIDLSEYTQEELRNAINLLLGKNNNDIANIIYNKKGHNHVDKEVSSLILMYALMVKLNLKKVQTLNTKNIFGLLLQKRCAP